MDCTAFIECLKEAFQFVQYLQYQCFWLYIFARKEQNMSQFDLCGDTRQRLPDFPKLGQSLLLIQTQKNCPFNSAANFDREPASPHDLEDLELSLELKMEKSQHPAINSATTIKKKKGGCTCKKTKCLKMYCQCFATGKLCGDECNCKGCGNCQGHLESRNRAHELLKAKGGEIRQGQRGCNCKKSQCQKKYCECFNAGVACTKDCRCLNCENSEEAKHGPGRGQSLQILESFID